MPKKCVALDLDLTIWKGVAGEDEIEIPPEYQDFQRCLLELQKRGILLAICSRNNYDDSIQVIRDHPDMILQEEHFSSIEVNWSAKTANIEQIALDLNMGLDCIVFVDDDPIMLTVVSLVLPSVLVLNSTDKEDCMGQLYDIFSVPYLTEEDTRRTELYETEKLRKELQSQCSTFDEFLDKLQMKLTIKLAALDDVDRLHQLFQRVNQFNLTTNRPDRDEVENAIEDVDFVFYTLQVKDIFGDCGLVGTAITYSGLQYWEICDFLLSCRVLGRTIEYEFLAEIIKDAIEDGAEKVWGFYIPTKKNTPAKEFYKECDFEQSSRDKSIWKLDLKHRQVFNNSRFEVIR